MHDLDSWQPMGCPRLDRLMAGDPLDSTAAGTALRLLAWEYTRPHRRHRPEFGDVLTRCAVICERAGNPDAIARLPIWRS